MRSLATRHHQQGAIIVTVAFVLLFLLGFMGIALDFGRLFIVKTELQTAMDSCALAAAQELDGASDALTRATSAGKTAGNLNKVHFQQASAGIDDAEITFSDSLIGTYSHTFTPIANAKYAKCLHTKSGMAPWLLQSMSAFSDNDSYKASNSVFALGVATRVSGQSACAIPVQITPKTATGPDYGYTPGEWIPSLYDEEKDNPDNPPPPLPGYFGWANLDGTPKAASTKSELVGTGHCDLKTGDTVKTPGGKFSASLEWNSRFGLYKNGAGNPDINSGVPDKTGYSYTEKNWPSTANASTDFMSKREKNRSYGNTVDKVKDGNEITGLKVSNSYMDNNMATYAQGANALATHGGNRRLVFAPFVVESKIDGWACVLMLHPIDGPKTTVYLEYVGNAASTTSPCASAGLPGGINGPLVPALVQ